MNITVDTRKFDQALKAFALVAKKDLEAAFRQQMKGVAEELINVTPPSHKGVTGAAAKRHGEQAIINNISKLMIPVTVAGRRGKQRIDEKSGLTAEALYLKFRNPQSAGGRVNVRNLGRPYFIPAPEVNALLRRLLSLVGTLSSGWVPAALMLNAKVPGWVSRHSSGNGSASIRRSPGQYLVRFANRIRFASEVKGLERQIQFAFTRQTSKMENQIEAILTKAGRKAGFKTRG